MARSRIGNGARRAYRSSATGYAAAGLLTAVAVAAAVVLLFGGHGTEATGSSGVAAAAPVQASASGCSLPAGDQSATSIQLSPPGVTDWHQVGNMQVPEAPATLGPQHGSGGWFYCFQHSPAGALLAAINVWASGTGADATAVAQHYSLEITPQQLGSTELPPGITLDGYQYESYTPSQAVVEVVMGVYGRGDVEATTTMAWVPSLNDWRVDVPPSGSIGGSIVDSSLAGYVAWAMP